MGPNEGAWLWTLFGDALFEVWEPVPGKVTPGSVLVVHRVQAVCDPREHCGS
jgi:hypothetical protein